MTLQQIEAVCGIVKNGFNMSVAAEAMNRSQPGLSRQVKELEIELGMQIFSRTRNKVVALTPQGEKIVRVAQRITRDMRSLQQIGAEESTELPKEIRIATTHVHARYSLPKVIRAFSARFPGVQLTLRQGDPQQCSELVTSGDADIGISTVTDKSLAEAVTVPLFKLSRCVVVPLGHPLLREKKMTLKKLVEYPIVAYSSAFSGRSIVDEAFARAGLKPQVICSAIDADVSKTYVDLGMGIAILAKIAIDPARDHNLVALDADHLFRPAVLNLVLRKHGYLTRHAYDFMSMFAPHIDGNVIRRAMDGADIDHARLVQRAPVADFHRTADADTALVPHGADR